MKIQIFTIPIVGGEEENSLMNNFLSSHRVIDVQQHIVADKYWTFCVRYVDKVSAEANPNNGKKEKTDYRKVLDESTFAKFSAIRAWRKEVSLDGQKTVNRSMLVFQVRNEYNPNLMLVSSSNCEKQHHSL